ncbi:nicotinamide riboside kinase isoform X2 [Nasonia vitripennis]|uniref:Active regulator of SIRT1 n=1 Tax=Nasonia vitripennis TaxID=7425 RepID=A0A7M7IYP6_NASVI|nr:nicotinamide riboside kinase isoform X2 [Nasonia vitripennis]
MSNALVRKSLELISFETDVIKDKRKKKKTKSSGALDLIPVNHRIISKNKKKGSTVLLKRSSKITVYDAKKQLETKSDPTEENVKRLLLLSGNRLDSDTSEKLLSRASKKLIHKKKEEKPVEEERTVFTEEDFKKFEAEYVDE